LAGALPHQGTVGLVRDAAISIRRVASSMTKRTAKRVSRALFHTSTVKKSAAASTSQCVFKNSC
jgi:hypothetical protein